MKRRLIQLTLPLLLLLFALPLSAAPPSVPVDIQILAVSDWHAQLDPLSVFGVGDFGGAAYLATYWAADRAANPNTLTLTGGDAYGASPPLSSFFDEVPAVEAMNMMGFDADTLGNHNFDRGIDHLQQMIDIADFQYVSANLLNRDDNLTGVKDFEIFDVNGIKVAVIGITNPEAPTLVFPGSFGTIEVVDPVFAAMRARARARAAGAQVFIAIVHMGVTSFDGAGNAQGPLIDFAESVRGFNLILGDHTDVMYSGIHNRALVVENRSKGRTYSRVELTVNPRSGRVLAQSVEFVEPTIVGVVPDAAIAAHLESYREQLAPIFNTVVGESTVYIPRADSCGQSSGRTCESLVGDLVTDAMRTIYGTDFALTNAGGLRADLTCPTIDNPTDFCPAYIPPNYPITRGQVQTVLPFGNSVVTFNLNGAELKGMLENGVSQMPASNGRFAQVSGLCFTYDIAMPAGSRVLSAVRQAGDGSCTGAAVDLTAGTTYSLATNDFVATGGDSYPNYSSRMVTLEVMDELVADWLVANTPVSPVLQGRIDCTSSGATACPVPLP